MFQIGRDSKTKMFQVFRFDKGQMGRVIGTGKTRSKAVENSVMSLTQAEAEELVQVLKKHYGHKAWRRLLESKGVEC